MPRTILFFTKAELAAVVAVGLITGIANDHIESLLFSWVGSVHSLVLLNDYLAFVTGGPLFGDFLLTWLQYGAVLAACLVRKPGAATIAMAINGVCQVFVNGTHDPHLFYVAPGLGADIVFALSRFRRYDLRTVCLAGSAAALFWYPVVWFTHGLYLYPATFLVPDLGVRLLGGAGGNGLEGAGIAYLVTRLAGREWKRPPAPGPAERGRVYQVGLAALLLGSVLVVSTLYIPAVSGLFLSIGPKIPTGVPTSEEYNPGYVLGAMVIFLTSGLLAFWRFRGRWSS